MIEREPYPGLRPFLRDEIEIFFGRERQIDTMIDQLRAHRFLAVTGTSGSGKSSLVRTGLLSALEAGFLDAAGGRWRIVDIRPGSKPFATFIPELLKSLDLPVTPADQELARASLARGPLSVAEFLSRVPDGRRDSLLILVDQFEELFRFGGPATRDDIEAFVGLLIGSVSQTDVPIYVVLTMRSDFLGDCARFEGLPELINRSQYLTPRMTREEYRRAIEDPARVFGGRVAPSVTSRLLNDMANVSDQLCLVQHALLVMWRRAKRRGDAEIRLEDYEAIGGLGEAISSHADHVLDTIELPPVEPAAGPAAPAEDGPSRNKLAIAERMFRRLTEGSGREGDIRRPATFGELLEITRAREADLRAVIDTFRAPGNNFLTPLPHLPIETETIIDISHESLIRQWKKLREWTNRESDSAATYRRLEQQAILWREGKAGLWSSPDLERAMIWRAEQRPSAAWARQYGREFDTALKFLDASRSANRNASRRRRAAVAAGIFVPAAIGLLAYWAYAADQQRHASNRQRDALVALQKTTNEALKSAEEWKRGALRAQLNSILANAEAAVGKGDYRRARGMALAADEVMAAADPTGSWKTEPDTRRRYMNALISTLRTDASDMAVADGSIGSQKAYGAYSLNSQVFAWATPYQLQFNDTKTGAAIKRYTLGGDDIKSLTLAPDGRLIALVTDREVKLFERDAGQRSTAATKLNEVRPSAVAFAQTSAGQLLAAVTPTGELSAWTLKADDAEPLKLESKPVMVGRSASTTAIDCEASRCVTFDGTRLRLYELEGSAREIASGSEDDFMPSSQGSTRIVLLKDMIFLGANTTWKSYKVEGTDSWQITGYSAGWLRTPLVTLSRNDSGSLVALSQVERWHRSMDINPWSNEPEGPRRMLDAREVVALAPNGTSSVVLEESNEGARLKIVHFTSSMRPCPGPCKGLATTISGETFLFSGPALLRLDPTEKEFVPIIDDLIEQIRNAFGSSSPENERDIELLGATPHPDRDEIYLMFSIGKGTKYLVANIDIKARKIKVADSTPQRTPVADIQGQSTTRAVPDASVENKKNVSVSAILKREFEQRGAWPRIAVNPWDNGSPAPSILIWPADADAREEYTETAPGARVRLSRTSALAIYRDRPLLEVIRIDEGSQRSGRTFSSWPLAGREVVGADFLADDRFYAAYAAGSIEVLLASRPNDPPSTRLKVGNDIVGATWSPLRQEFVVLSRRRDGDETTAVGLFDTSGALRHSQEQGGSVLAVQDIEADKALVLGANGYTVMPIVRRASELGTEEYARAITERWLLRDDVVKAGLTVLDGESPVAPDAAIIPECKLNGVDGKAFADELWPRRRRREDDAYTAACSGLYHMRAGSGFAAWASSLLTARYLTGGDLYGERGGLLAYQLARFARNDHVAALEIRTQLREERGECTSPARRRLLSLGIIEGGVLGSQDITWWWSCSAEGTAWLPEGAEPRLQELARNGDPMAHTMLGMLLERGGGAPVEALAHYYAASLIFHNLRRFLAAHDFAQMSERWQGAEGMASRQRVALASHQSQERVLEARAKAEQWIDAIPKAAEAGPARDTFAAHTASAVVAAMEADLVKDTEEGLAKLATALGGDESRLVGVGLEARYYLSKQYLDAGADDEKVRPLFLSILRTAANVTDRGYLNALSNATLGYFENKTILTPGESDILKGIAHEAVDRLAGPSPPRLLDEQKRRAIRLFASSAPAGRKSLVEFAILMLANEEQIANERNGWKALLDEQRKVHDLLSEETDLADYRTIIGALSWRYVDAARRLSSSQSEARSDRKLSEELETQAAITLNEGLKLHMLVWRLQGKDFSGFERLSSGHQYAAIIAGNASRVADAFTHYQQSVAIKKAEMERRGKEDATIWNSIAAAAENLATSLEEKADTETATELALSLRRDAVEARLKAKALGKDETNEEVFSALGQLSRTQGLAGQYEASFISAGEAYRLLSATQAGDIGAERLRSNAIFLGYALSRLNQRRRAEISAESAIRCDQEAGHIYDPLLPGTGKLFGRIKENDALKYCEEALAQDRDNPRFIFQLGRALDKKSRAVTDDSAIKSRVREAYRRAADMGYPVAFNNLATVLNSSKEQAEEAYLNLEYFNRTVHCCGRDIAHYLLGRLDGSNRVALGYATLDLLEWAAELGDPAAHEEMAQIFADVALPKLKPQWAALTPPELAALRVIHLLKAVKLHEKAKREADVRRVTALAEAAAGGLSSQQLEAARGRVAEWGPKGFRDAPSWMVPEEAKF